VPIRVVVAEDHPEFREMLCEQLRLAGDLAVVEEARSGWEAVAAVGRVRPDVLTLDLDLPGLHGLDVLRVVRWYSPETKVLILSGHDEEQMIREALKQGARGYIVKGEPVNLEKAVKVVHRGEVWARRTVLASVIEELSRLASLTLPGRGAEAALA
jgi:DNA-binding NarL/FixJ family response regulator